MSLLLKIYSFVEVTYLLKQNKNTHTHTHTHTHTPNTQRKITLFKNKPPIFIKGEGGPNYDANAYRNVE